MLQLSSTISQRPVLSLRTGRQIATTTQLLINPNNLLIEGFYCVDTISKQRLVLRIHDIREHAPQGFLVNDHDALAEPQDLVRLKEVIATNFSLLDKTVVTENKKRLGKVTDFAFDSASFFIQKLYVGQSMLRSFSGGQLSVDRGQIVEITDKKIIVQDPLQGIKDTATASVPAV